LRNLSSCSSLLLLFVSPVVASAQTAAKSAAADTPASTQHAIELVEQGRCKEALPVLERATPHLNDKQLKYHAAMAQARCAMALDRKPAALSALLLLKRDFPDDPEVLYVTVHYFSELASRTSQELAAKAPASAQARMLEAEAFESRGAWDEAAGIYRAILEQNPAAPRIHYRLGQVLLSKAGETGPVDEARAEFLKELQVDPHNASAEFILGELSRRAGQWDDAAQHFSRASTLDVGFSEAYLAWGISLTSGRKFAEAISPLETYVRMQPEDPSGHYQLAIAYERTGNKEQAARQITLRDQTAAAQHKATGADGRPVR
jgi:tetratricopeptide (TPR) repeat protein